MMNIINNQANMGYLAEEVEWRDTKDPIFPYAANVNNFHWQLRINNFPEENLYTLIINGEQKINFNDWPENWMV